MSLTYTLSVPIHPSTRIELMHYARKHRISMTQLARELLTQGLAALHESYEEPEREVYYIRLNEIELERLLKLGHKIQPDGDFCVGSYEQTLYDIPEHVRQSLLHQTWDAT